MAGIRFSSHAANVLLALFVTFLWSTSWVLVKIGLADIAPLSFAGIRYTLAAVLLIPFLLWSGRRSTFKKLTGNDWVRLVVLGLVFYTLTQGAMFVGLAYLRPATLSMFLSFSPILVALVAIPTLKEMPTPLQWAGMGVYLAGAVLYLWPAGVGVGPTVGLAAATVGLLANVASTVLGRHVNRHGHLPPLVVTTVSMAVGAAVLLAVGRVHDGPQTLSAQSWAIVAWLAVVNTAFAFTLWNVTLRTLSAAESSVINNTMLVQIALLAWICLGESLTPLEIVGIVLAAGGATVAQLRPTVARGRNADAGCPEYTPLSPE